MSKAIFVVLAFVLMFVTCDLFDDIKPPTDNTVDTAPIKPDVDNKGESDTKDTNGIDQIITHTVTFDSNGGTVRNPITVNHGNTINRPINPTKSGDAFVGWFFDGTEFDFDTVINNDITLISRWVPSWLPSELRELHSCEGTWTRVSLSENVTHTNFECARDMIDELVGVINPGYKGIENAVVNNYGASYSYFQSQGWDDNNRETRITMARTYAFQYYLQYLQLQDYVIQRGDLIIRNIRDSGTFDSSVYDPPINTVNQVSSRLWIYEMNPGIVAVSVSGGIRRGSVERHSIDSFFVIYSEERIGTKSGWIYTFTPEDGEPYVYDLRTITYYNR